MEKAPALDPMPLYESCMVTFYRGAPAPGAPVVPTPLNITALNQRRYEIVNIPHDPCAYQCASSWVCPSYNTVAVLKLKNRGIPKESLT